ncbi:S1 family peptidase [Streptomyces sp. NPDC002004]
MSHRRIPKRKAVLAGSGAVAVAAAAVLLPHANASQTGPDQTATLPHAATEKAGSASAARIVSQLSTRLGANYAGAYFDAKKKQLVVNVAGGGDRSAAEVKQAGAVPRQVSNSMAELKAAAHTLRQRAAVPGTAWAIDPRTNRIRVTTDRTVTGAKWNRVESTVRSLGARAGDIHKSAGQFKPFVSGGDAIFGGNARCSLGFNVTTSDGKPAFLTAGHCGVAAKQWTDANGAPLGTVQKATFPGDGDFALVTYDDQNTQAPSEVATGNGQTVQIKQAADAAVGQQVFRMGSTTGLHDGSVTGLDATVTYPEGTVTGLIQTDVCAEPGDSGGSLFTQDGNAVGLTSGGSGDCKSGGETFFQPVTTALTATGATIGNGGGDANGGGADQNGGDQSGANGGGADQNGGDQSGANGGGADQNGGGADQNGGDQSGANGGGADQSAAPGDGADQNGAAGSGADQSGAAGSGADPNGSSGTGADQSGSDGISANGN